MHRSLVRKSCRGWVHPTFAKYPRMHLLPSSATEPPRPSIYAGCPNARREGSSQTGVSGCRPFWGLNTQESFPGQHATHHPLIGGWKVDGGELRGILNALPPGCVGSQISHHQHEMYVSMRKVIEEVGRAQGFALGNRK